MTSTQQILGDMFGPDEDDSNERYTRRTDFDRWNEEFRFSLDVCATPKSAKLERYFTKADNGLAQSWGQERVYCNPPFEHLPDWVAKAWEESNPVTVMLVPAWTDRKWWHALVEPWRDRPSTRHKRGASLRVRFLPGRLRFGSPHDPEGLEAQSPAFWVCHLIWDRS